MTKVIALYKATSPDQVPAFLGLFSSKEGVQKFLQHKDKRHYYTREYIIDNLLIS